MPFDARGLERKRVRRDQKLRVRLALDLQRTAHLLEVSRARSARCIPPVRLSDVLRPVIKLNVAADDRLVGVGMIFRMVGAQPGAAVANLHVAVGIVNLARLCAADSLPVRQRPGPPAGATAPLAAGAAVATTRATYRRGIRRRRPARRLAMMIASCAISPRKSRSGKQHARLTSPRTSDNARPRSMNAPAGLDLLELCTSECSALRYPCAWLVARVCSGCPTRRMLRVGPCLSRSPRHQHEHLSRKRLQPCTLPTTPVLAPVRPPARLRYNPHVPPAPGRGKPSAAQNETVVHNLQAVRRSE